MPFKSQLTDVTPDERHRDLVSNFFWSQLDKYQRNVLFVHHETGRQWTGGQIKETSAKLARALMERGLEPGASCVTFYKHCDYIQLVALGVLFAGGSICAGYSDDPNDEHHYMLSVMQPSFVFIKHQLVEATLENRKSLALAFTVVVMDDDALDEHQFGRLVAAAHKQSARLVGLHHHLLAPPKADGGAGAELPVQVDPQQPAFVILTSGSTGRPKPVGRSQRNSLYVCHSFIGARELWDLNESSVMAAHLALDHGTGIFNLKQCLATGYKSIIIDGYQLDSMLDAIERHQITDLVLGSALVHNLISSRRVQQLLTATSQHSDSSPPLSSLRNLLAVGSTIASSEAVRSFVSKLPQCSVRQAFGMTECGFLCVVPRELALRQPELDYRCVGPALPNVEFKLLDSATGQEVTQFDRPGELYVRGPTVSPGYVGEQFAEQARASFLPDGYYKSNDLCSIGSDGMLRVLGRISEVLCLGDGWKALPSEIEHVILQHPHVSEVAVVGMPNPSLPTCDAPRAYVVPRTGVKVVESVAEESGGEQPKSSATVAGKSQSASADQLRAVRETDAAARNEMVNAKQIMDFVAARLSEPKHLVGGVKFLNELPRTSIGKVDKRALKTADGL